MTPKKSDISVTSDSGLCPSPTEHEYKPRYFDEPNCLSSDKENMPPIESITPPPLGNLSIEEENNEIKHEAYIVGDQCSQKFRLTPQIKLSIPKEED